VLSMRAAIIVSTELCDNVPDDAIFRIRKIVVIAAAVEAVEHAHRNSKQPIWLGYILGACSLEIQ
jgi:hypothetical protein